MTTTIPAEDLPRALAKKMQWEVINMGHAGFIFVSPCKKISTNNEGGFRADVWMDQFKPHLSHDHAQICVEECFKRGVIQEYYKALMVLIRKRYGFDCELILVLRATPEEQAFAALAALTEK